MLACVRSAMLFGVEGLIVDVQVHVSTGLPSYTFVGLPDAAVREARDRVRAALLSSGSRWPQRRVTVNLAPSGVRKSGPGLDLPFALGLMVASDELPDGVLDGVGVIGELGLDGSLRPVPGVLAMVDALRRSGADRRAAAGRQRRRKPRWLPGSGSCRRRSLAQVRSGPQGRGGLAGAAPDAAPTCSATTNSTTTSSRTLPSFEVSAAAVRPSRWRPPAATTSSWSGRRAPARRCWPAAFRRSSLRSMTTSLSR